MTEENISQEFRLKNIDQLFKKSKLIDEQKAQKGFHNSYFRF